MSVSTTFTDNSSSDTGSPGPRLSSRRGSISAPDPFARNVNSSPKGKKSRLTILQVPPSCEGSSSVAAESQENVEPLQRCASISTALWSGGSSHRSSEVGQSRGKRMSFARSSFSPVVQPAVVQPAVGGGSASESTSSRSRSMSNSSYFPFAVKGNVQPNNLSPFQAKRLSLSPQQICDLAQTSLKSATVEGTSDAASRPSISSRSLFVSSRGSVPSDSGRHLPDDRPVSPAAFMPLPDLHYLPFVDRPSEVTALLASDSNSRFMTLLKQIFPPPHLLNSLGNPDELDPVDWPFHCLVSYITECPRSKSADHVWVTDIRRCIRARSEVVWERFKDLLGVPPELHVDLAIESSGNETGTEIPEFDDEDEAWVEPISHASSPLIPISVSPVINSTPSSTDMGDYEIGHGCRRRGMETIGEGEEEENVVTVTDIRGNTYEYETTPAEHILEPSAEQINALSLYTRMSVSDDIATSQDPGVSLPSTGLDDVFFARTQSARSVAEGHPNHGVPPTSGDSDPSFSFNTARRLSTSVPDYKREPGNPLFPSNFRQLSVSPTLPANNSASRPRESLTPRPYSSRRYTLAAVGSRSEEYADRNRRWSDHPILGERDSGNNGADERWCG